MAWDGKIPFVNDKPLIYVDYWLKDVEWRDNEPFEDILTFKTYSRGRSAARLVFLSKALKCNVEMFLGDFSSIVPLLQKGKLSGTFKFVKKGQNFGIQRIEVDACPIGL